MYCIFVSDLIVYFRFWIYEGYEWRVRFEDAYVDFS